MNNCSYNKMKYTLCQEEKKDLIQIIFDIFQFFCVKEFDDRDSEAVTKLQYSKDPRILCRTVQNMEQGGQGNGRTIR